MKITAISVQAKNNDRVNVSVDGSYRFSLDIFQVGELGIKIGNDYDEARLIEIEQESQFGKLYARALEYSIMRPHSVKEIKDYLWRKTRVTRYKARDGSIKEREGVSQSITERVLQRLIDRGYVDDVAFTRFWVEQRNQIKGLSQRKLIAELRAKGVSSDVIDNALASTARTDEDEIQKVLRKKRARYSDDTKLIAYLMRQGFSYEDSKSAVQSESEE